MMTFEERKETALDLVMNFLDRFAPPRGLSEEQQAKQLAAIADAFARKMPETEAFEEAVTGVLNRVADSHQSSTWPSQGAFVLAMPAKPPAFRSAPETYSQEATDEAMIKAMRANEGVDERKLWSPDATASVPHELLDKYRRSSIRSHVSAYHEDARGKMTKKYGSVVEPYFDELEISSSTAAER
ncbi:hypothetical protein [Mameliella alba]|uniref:hypothetical protein n=1 Tax=Mameliella alba TaxID=561184 RepID=UPI00142FB09E|nr:hypothetical protein [Mameliella alba]